MNDERKKDLESVKRLRKDDRFPRIVIIIVIAEFCERFSYSGMRAFLTLYLRSKLGYSDDGATEIYHIFSTLVYLFPIFGGILADNYLGKFRTILYMLFVYAAGNLLVALTAIPQLELPGRLYTLIGLLMITIGTGGIKPCVTAFGGDQFTLPEQERHLAIFFSVLYFSLCTGSLIAKTVSPILRSEVSCFGDKDCYSLAFGAPGFVVIVAIIIFASARKRYVMKKPEGNVVFDFVKCVAFGLKNAMKRRGSTTQRGHWLDGIEDRFDKQFIQDVKQTLSVLTLFAVLPVFFALLDQLGSRWTLQATKMDGRFGFITVKPDQMQVLVPTFILILIPLSQKYIYPWLAKRNILKNPLHKLTLGGVLAGVAFIASGSVEIYLKTTYPELPRPGYSQLRVFNGNPCSLSIHNDSHNIIYTIPPLSHFSKKDILITGEKTVLFQFGGSCIEPREEEFLLRENAAVSFFVNGDRIMRYEDYVDKSKSGFPIVRFLVSESLNKTNATFYNKRLNEIEAVIGVGVSRRYEMFAGSYSLQVDNQLVGQDMEIESGGVYTILLDKTGKGYSARLIVLTAANSISMALLLPQFLIMSAAENVTSKSQIVQYEIGKLEYTSELQLLLGYDKNESSERTVLFAVTGNEFAFKESPESMKAVMTAIWLLTEAVGNVIIIVITRLFVAYSQETQFFIYTAMMFVSIAVFFWLSRDYRPQNVKMQDSAATNRKDSRALYQQVRQTEECLDH